MENKDLQAVISLRKELHEHPEPSEHEVETRRRLMEFLKKHTKVKIVDKGRWFYAIKEEEGAKETIAFRADHDAIISEDGNAFHGCGHDGHSATLCGLAMELDNVETGKNIVYLFQHAEENGAGAKECVEIFDEVDIDRIYGFHNWPHFELGKPIVKKGTFMCASKGLTISFLGKQSHASEPEHGVNPIYLIGKIIELVKPLSEFQGYVPSNWNGIDFSSMVLCTIIHVRLGEEGAFGVSPSRGEISLTLRGATLEDLNKLEESIKNFAMKESKKEGMEVSFKISDEFPDTTNDEGEVERIVSIFEKHGVNPYWLEEPIRSSEDFGWYQKEVPGAFFYIGSGLDQPDLHTIEFDFPDSIIPEAISYLRWIAQD
ncbi:MAG: amidohydrolase [Tissierellia bacterium]|nr:amidohydrolase [Tissierellia bacterium]